MSTDASNDQIWPSCCGNCQLTACDPFCKHRPNRDLYVQSMTMPIKVTGKNGKEIFTTWAKEWPKFKKEFGIE